LGITAENEYLSNRIEEEGTKIWGCGKGLKGYNLGHEYLTLKVQVLRTPYGEVQRTLMKTFYHVPRKGQGTGSLGSNHWMAKIPVIIDKETVPQG